jgi:hypothetical protein
MLHREPLREFLVSVRRGKFEKKEEKTWEKIRGQNWKKIGKKFNSDNFGSVYQFTVSNWWIFDSRVQLALDLHTLEFDRVMGPIYEYQYSNILPIVFRFCSEVSPRFLVFRFCSEVSPRFLVFRFCSGF